MFRIAPRRPVFQRPEREDKPQPPKRTREEIDHCRFLGKHLTMIEAQQYREVLNAVEVGCRSCDKSTPGDETPLQHCANGDAGPIAWRTKCETCLRYQDKLSIIERGLMSVPPAPTCEQQRGVILCGGGAYQATQYVTVKMIRQFSPDIPIVLFHGHNEPLNEEPFRDLLTIVKGPPDVPAGWMMKSYALLKSPFVRSLFFDADFYPTCPVEPHFDAPSGVLCANSCYHAIQWDKYGLTNDGRPPLDGGFWMVDRLRHWNLVWLFYYLNTLHYQQTYEWGVGDQDQLRAALRGCNIVYDSVGQAELIGAAAVYPNAGVHLWAEKFRDKQGGVRATLRRPTPQGNLPFQSDAFKNFYDYIKRYGG